LPRHASPPQLPFRGHIDDDSCMSWASILPAVAVTIAVHALALRVAAALMVEARVRYALALKIVAIEYAAILLAAGAIAVVDPGSVALAVAAGSLAYVFTGAACIGFWLSFPEGERVGLGNGVLIQAIQIPLLIPVIIVGSFAL
jgi:hypothetical protein